MRLVTRSKDIHLEGVTGDVEVENSNGDIEIHPGGQAADGQDDDHRQARRHHAGAAGECRVPGRCHHAQGRHHLRLQPPADGDRPTALRTPPEPSATARPSCRSTPIRETSASTRDKVRSSRTATPTPHCGVGFCVVIVSSCAVCAESLELATTARTLETASSIGEIGRVDDDGVGRRHQRRDGCGCGRADRGRQGLRWYAALLRECRVPFCATRRSARMRASASRKTFTSALGNTAVPMSRPSITTPPCAPISRWRRDHDFAHRRMHRHARGGQGDVALREYAATHRDHPAARGCRRAEGQVELRYCRRDGAAHPDRPSETCCSSALSASARYMAPLSRLT